MSMKKWQESVNEKAEVEKQNASILAAIKNNKIKEELGLLSGEKLFKPITSRLDTIQEGAPKEEKEEVPDYGMDEFDLINPFDGDFNPDAETPTPTPTSTPPSHHHHHQHHHHHHHQRGVQPPKPQNGMNLKPQHRYRL